MRRRWIPRLFPSPLEGDFRRLSVFSTLLLAATLSAFSAAAEPDWAEAFRRYVGSPAHLNEIGRSVQQLEQRLAPECVQILKGLDRVELRIIQPPVFLPGLPIPQAGQWREQVRIDRCGEPVLHNVLVTAVNRGTPHLTLLLPGSSKADGRLQLDASSTVFAIATARAGGDCRASAQHIVDTAFDRWLGRSAEKPLAERLWREIWTVRLCAQRVRVQVDFAPDGRGGFTFQADLPQSGQ